MNSETILAQAQRIASSVQGRRIGDVYPEALEFLRRFAGEKSAFYLQLAKVSPTAATEYVEGRIIDSLTSFVTFIENGLSDEISLERRAQLDVVSDILGQAQNLLDTNKVHPAAPAVLIGAALEEFLRNWCEAAGTGRDGRKPSLSAYAEALLADGHITKQDVKDITSWGGIRNHAAHGEWDAVADRNRVRLMLDGVNLFMRRYT